MAASADRLDDFLADARAQGRPAVSISPGLAAELLGFAPDAAYWAGRELDGWVVDAGTVVTFSPIAADHAAEQADGHGVETTDVRIVIDWLRSDEVEPGPGIYRTAAAESVRFGETDDVTTLPGPDVRVATNAVIGYPGGEAHASLDEPRLRRLAVLAAEMQEIRAADDGGGSGI